MQILLDISVARKQSAPRLWESDIALLQKLSFIIILLGCGFVAHLVFSLI